jgi:hypothetical protein
MIANNDTFLKISEGTTEDINEEAKTSALPIMRCKKADRVPTGAIMLLVLPLYWLGTL